MDKLSTIPTLGPFQASGDRIEEQMRETLFLVRFKRIATNSYTSDPKVSLSQPRLSEVISGST